MTERQKLSAQRAWEMRRLRYGYPTALDVYTVLIYQGHRVEQARALAPWVHRALPKPKVDSL